jgi:hypothetical protein
VVFDADAQDTYLQLVASGVRMGVAAAKAGTSPRAVSHLAHRDRGFADRLAAAKTAGREARIPHGTPGGYDNYDCRCRPCTVAASNARAQRGGRSHTDDEATAGEVIPLPDPKPAAQLADGGAESPVLLLLPKVS